MAWENGCCNLFAAFVTHHPKRRIRNRILELIDAVYDQVSLNLPYTFDNGLLGIGCGFEYIINNGFIETDSNEILSELDFWVMNLIDSRTINNLNLDKGICGIGYYLYCRLKKRMNDNVHLSKTLCTALFFRSIGVSLSGSGEGSSFSNSFSKTDTSVSYLEKCKP